MNRILPVLWLICCCTVWTSCLTKRGTGSSQVQPGDSAVIDTARSKDSVTGTVVSDPGEAALWDQLQQSHTDYATFSGKAHLAYEGADNSQEFDLNIRLEKDRRIWVSITALLGLEAARVMVTPDSLFAIDRLHHDAYVMPLSQAAQLLPVPADFQIMQALILGASLPANATFAGMQQTGDTAVLLGLGPFGRQELYIKRADSLLFRQSLQQDPNSINIINDGFRMIGERKFPMQREIQAFSSGVNHHIWMEFEEVHFNQELEMNFSIPQKYQKR